MSITQRRYKILIDFNAVHQFLTDTYDLETLNSYLLPQYFEYAHHLQWFDYIRAHRMGLWEEDGQLVAVACYEMPIGTVHLHSKSAYSFLLPEMLEWSEKEISSCEDGKRVLNVWITNKELQKQELLRQNGYQSVHSEPVKIFRYENKFMERKLPEGYTIIDGTNVDYEKLAECFWRGFDHDEVPPQVNVDGNMQTLNAPHGTGHYRAD